MKLIEWPHYSRPYLESQELSESFLKRFWEKVMITDACWIWIGSRTPDGYGKIWGGIPAPNMNWLRAHRAAWLICRGLIPDGLQVLHDCPEKDNKLCVNPWHCFLGTNEDNMEDGKQKNQFVRGSDQHLSKLTDRKVISIRQLWATDRFTQQELADLFGIAQSGISGIILRKTWKHI